MNDLLSQVEPMIPALRRYARGLIKDRETADDIVQDCLERVVKNWSRRREANARSWVFAILHNLAINKMRQEVRRAGTITIDDAAEVTTAIEASQDTTLFGQDVLAAIEGLPPDYRSILLLVAVEHLSYSEAATVLDVPLGTVMSRLSRARDQLRHILEAKPAGSPNARPYLRRVK